MIRAGISDGVSGVLKSVFVLGKAFLSFHAYREQLHSGRL